MLKTPDGSQTDVLVTDNGNGNFTITWTAEMVGKHKVVVKFGGKEVPGKSICSQRFDEGQYYDAVFFLKLLRCNLLLESCKVRRYLLCFSEGYLSCWPGVLPIGREYRITAFEVSCFFNPQNWPLEECLLYY